MPPQPAPAEVQTISAAHAQRLTSPGQSVINDFNKANKSKGFTARMPNQQQARDLNKSVEGIGKGVGKLGTARSANETIKTQNKAAKGPGFTDRPTPNKGIDGMTAKTNGQQSVSRNVPQASQNKGIEAARQKSSSKQAGTGTQAKSASNKGIASYQNKTSSPSSSVAKSNSSLAASAPRSVGSSAGKSSGGSGAGKSGGGQSR